MFLVLVKNDNRMVLVFVIALLIGTAIMQFNSLILIFIQSFLPVGISNIQSIGITLGIVILLIIVLRAVMGKRSSVRSLLGGLTR